MPRTPRAKASEVVPLDAGTVLAAGTVEGRAVPWKSPTVGRNGGVVHGRDYKRYLSWQQTIALVASTHRRRGCPYGGPVALTACFYLRRKGSEPDIDNLAKAFSDALQGVVYVNDVQIVRSDKHKVMSATERERVEYRVEAVA